MNTQSETHQELLIACAWWKHQVSLSTNPKISMETASRFESTLLHCLKEKVHNFWFPGQPNRGQAFRSIALERYSSPDRCLLQAAEAAGIQNILNCFPVHTESIIMWIDPGEVVVKTGVSYSHNMKEDIIYSSNSSRNPSPPKTQPTAHRKTTPPSIHRPPSPSKIVITPKHTPTHTKSTHVNNESSSVPIREFRPSFSHPQTFSQPQTFQQQFWMPSFSDERVTVSA